MKLAATSVDNSLPDAVGAFVDWVLTKSNWRVTERGGGGEEDVPVRARHICLMFRRLEKWMTGDITGPTFLATAQKATVKMNGMSPDVDFSKSFDGLGPNFVNQINQSITYDIVKNGKLVPFQNGKFYDLTQLTIGKPLSAENLPPGGQ